MSGPAWHQFLTIVECPACRPSKGRTWDKEDADGELVIVTVEPCEKHQRMLDKQGWTLR